MGEKKKRGFSVIGRFAKGAAGVFRGMYQMQDGNWSGAMRSISNGFSEGQPISIDNSSENFDSANSGKSTYRCQNQTCGYKITNISNQEIHETKPERCPNCNSPLMRELATHSNSHEQNHISSMNKVTYVCVVSTCKYEVGPVHPMTDIGECVNCGSKMKRK